jgi:hypothetical protein
VPRRPPVRSADTRPYVCFLFGTNNPQYSRPAFMRTPITAYLTSTTVPRSSSTYLQPRLDHVERGGEHGSRAPRNATHRQHLRRAARHASPPRRLRQQCCLMTHAAPSNHPFVSLSEPAWFGGDLTSTALTHAAAPPHPAPPSTPRSVVSGVDSGAGRVALWCSIAPWPSCRQLASPPPARRRVWAHAP